MSRDHSKQRKNEHHSLKNLPSEVLLKARSTLVSLGGALKHKHDHDKGKSSKQERVKEKKSQDSLKSSRSEPEFSEMRKKHRSRIEENTIREYGSLRPRPVSVGGAKHYDKELDFRCGSLPRDTSPMPRHADPTEEVCMQSRLYIPVAERLSSQDVQMQETNEKPRKKLSFREPEIIISSDRGSATSGRSNKHMGVNSLSRRPNRTSLRNEQFSFSMECLESDLESQAMRIVRTVGQAFEVCHKMQVNSPGEPVTSASSVVEEPVPSCSDVAASKEVVSECGVSEAASAAPVVEEVAAAKEEVLRPSHLDLLPPPPKNENRRTRTIQTPNIQLSDLPECITKVEVAVEATSDTSTPLSAQHQLQLLRERLDQQTQQTRAAVAQLLLLRDQLAAEQAARCEAQARTHQLLVHNKELLEHIASLVAHLQDRERTSPIRPINAQQLTLLPQTQKFTSCNGNLATNGELIDLFSPNNNTKPLPNNNGTHSPFRTLPSPAGAASAPTFGDMSDEQIQDYLINRFEEMGGFPNKTPAKSTFNANQQFFQNCQAFPNIPPLVSHYSNADLQSLLNHSVFNEPPNSGNLAMSVAQSDASLFSPGSPDSQDSSKDSSDSSSEEGIPFIKPLSHNGMLTATGEDGRVRLIVPVSPSESVSDVGGTSEELQASCAGGSGNTLKVPGTTAPNAPITRTTSEKVPNRSEMMTAMRQQWTRHTTK